MSTGWVLGNDRNTWNGNLVNTRFGWAWVPSALVMSPRVKAGTPFWSMMVAVPLLRAITNGLSATGPVLVLWVGLLMTIWNVLGTGKLGANGVTGSGGG